jgi:hypothetical protein
LYSKIAPSDPSLLDYGLSTETSGPLAGGDDFDFSGSFIVFSATKSQDMTNHFLKDADACYVEAKQTLIQKDFRMYGLLLCLFALAIS